MLLGIQIRAARAALGWSIDKLAEKSGVSGRTIKRFEALNGLPPSRSSTLYDLQTTFEAAGIEFIGTPEDGPGIRARIRPSDLPSALMRENRS
jgi:transcriptional regulator with XRE-family HTH domain